MKIKIGSIYKDTWGCKWQVIDYNKDTGKWLLKLTDGFFKSDFSTAEIKRLFKLVSP